MLSQQIVRNGDIKTIIFASFTGYLPTGDEGDGVEEGLEEKLEDRLADWLGEALALRLYGLRVILVCL